MISSIEQREVDSADTRSRVDRGQAAAGGVFDQMLRSLSGAGDSDSNSNASAARQVAQANQEAIANQRISKDDLRKMDEEVERRTADTDPNPRVMDSGAVEIVLAEFGLGGLAGLLQPSHSEAVALLEQRAPHSGQSQYSSSSAMGTTQTNDAETKTGDAKGKPSSPESTQANHKTPTVIQTKTASHAELQSPSTPKTLRQATTLETAARQTVPDKMISKATKAITQPARLSPYQPSASTIQSSGSSQVKGDSQGELGLQSRDQTKQDELGKLKSKGQSEEPLPREVQKKTIDDVLRVLRSNLHQRHSVVKIQLSPPELGKLTIDLRTDGDTVRIKMEAENANVRELLQSNSATLSSTLRAQGLTLEQYEVVLSDTEPALENFEQEFGTHGAQDHSLTDAGNHHVKTDHGDEAVGVSGQSEWPTDVIADGHVDIRV